MPTESVGETRRFIQYQDLNAHGTLFGGRMAMWIDEAAGIYSVCQMKTRRVVTIKISELVFKHPVHLHDILEFRCSTRREGKTSLTVDCRVLRLFNGDPVEVAHAEVTFVSVNEQGIPTTWKKATQEKHT